MKIFWISNNNSRKIFDIPTILLKSYRKSIWDISLADDRFVMKQMSRLEAQSFRDFAPQYFQYMDKALKEQVSTFPIYLYLHCELTVAGIAKRLGHSNLKIGLFWPAHFKVDRLFDLPA